jgi:hypothetical protein
MSNTVTLTPVAQPVQARASLTAEQVNALKAVLSSANVIVLPAEKTVNDITNFVMAVQPNGGGFLNVTLK